MNSIKGANSIGAKLTALLGSASLLTLAYASSAYAQGEQVAQAEEIPETVLITGSLIRGTAAVGVPVTNLSPMDFAVTGALTTAELFRTFPAANVSPGAPGTSAGNFVARSTRVNLRGLDTGDAVRSLLMVDGMRYPAQGQGLCMIDPSIIPALALDHVDILVDGASATYGSDAIGGVINIILKRNVDGATTQLRWTTAEGGKNRYLASAIWGRTWDGGQITLSYEWYNETPVMGKAHSNFTTDFTPWGFDDRTWLGSATPGIISNGAARQPGGGQVGTSAALGRGCTNCYAFPPATAHNWDPGTTGVGPTAPYSGSTLDWSTLNTAANSGTNGLRNQFNSYDLSWFEPNQDRNAAVLTVDQRLTRNISFYGSAFYSNRRAMMWNPGAITPTANAIIQGATVPTFNPYYPVGAPGGLRVYYHLGHEVESLIAAHVLGDRYQMGLNIALPAGWASQVWFAETFDKTAYNTRGTVNKAAISAALGWTLPATPASGSTPAIATWTKPSSVPYLNLFCDPTAFQCNSDETLAYITGMRALDERYKINEKGIKADGPLFDLPGGTVKAAVGATYTTFAFSIVSLDNTNASSLILPYQVNAERRAVWAVFSQVNIPVFSEANGIPLIRRLELEVSWRHDQYSDVGGTSNPKVAFNWSLIEDLTIRGTWGNSFRAPSFGELSALANVAINGQNLLNAGLAVNPDPIVAGCGTPSNPTALPPVGSGAWKLMSSFGDGTPGSTSVCPSGSVTLPSGYPLDNVRRPHGINILGGVGAAAPVRAGGFNGGPDLEPEKATNWGIGFDYTPSANFLTGLNIQATYYQIKLNGTLRNFGQPNSTNFNDPDTGANAVFVPTDWLDSGLPGAAACTNNLLPTTCAPFQDAVNGLLLHPRAQVSPQAQTVIMWIHDGGTVNRGWQKLEGIDFQASYDWEWGDIGAFNTGFIGTYYLRNRVKSSSISPVVDYLHQTVGTPGINEAEGVATNPRFRYRVRLGWANGPWSLTGFMDYSAHYYHLQTPPPNVNGNFCASNGGLDALGMGGTYACAIDDYSNITPSHYTFDLSLGYNTMDTPANEYLRNIGIQLVVQNVLDKHAQFQYKPSTAGGPPSAIAAFGGPGGGASNAGRTISVILTKEW